ncbi:N-acetylglucosamine-1-phosphodiester alpha-N-acetylglucosaminidase-like [Oopsacas minuta]|uniref:N-acetylglucosamine-1-phosphodiester alpha-N-acetylglucosaminidase-like n=1 Tax=Oopsacas minuta TaxID=111878 RepID=A0AAV7JCW4_9METZ|nr:N-acetylglucosamine-1-phosphodiester alpha-N-acetylglucosaminidase-like [Oopsacas minuta]
MINLLQLSILLALLQLGLTLNKEAGEYTNIRNAKSIRAEPIASSLTDILSPFSDNPRLERSTNKTTNFTHFYETHEPNPDEYPHIQTLQFIDATTDPKRSALGTVTFVDHPRTTFSVLEPYTTGTCNGFWPVRATVMTTASKRNGGCIVAQNAGFFRMGTSACLGNIVSDGRFVRESANVVNANFGIKASGNIYVGYLSNEEVKDKTDPFIQLVSGIIWLVKNGSNFVNESMHIESDNNEDTGNLTHFVNVISARTAIGHDEQGRVMMVVIDGQTRKRGINLFELADIMIRQGAVNAINLDGGGSATLIRDGVLGNHVSDHCPSPEYRCMRQVSTILCAHKESCVPQDCNQHGECVEGECECSEPWTGLDCAELMCGNGTCGEHGSCETGGTCVCDDGWIGELCENTCPIHFYGTNCNRVCWCSTHGTCHPETGVCICSPGYEGNKCQDECSEGKYGDKCLEECVCSGNSSCHHVMGCLCNDGWEGEDCNISIQEPNTTTNTTELPQIDSDTTVSTTTQTSAASTSQSTTTEPISSATTISTQKISTASSTTINSPVDTDASTFTTTTQPISTDANTTQVITTEVYIPNKISDILEFNLTECIQPILFSSMPLLLCSCLSNVLICLASWLYWGGYKRRMLKRRGNYSEARQFKIKNPIGRKINDRESTILHKIKRKPNPPSYQLVSTQLANESSDSSS